MALLQQRNVFGMNIEANCAFMDGNILMFDAMKGLSKAISLGWSKANIDVVIYQVGAFGVGASKPDLNDGSI